MKVYIIDNYDSFTYNLYQYIGEILSTARLKGEIDAFDIVVKRNNQVSLEQVRAANPDRLIISPGPGSPDDPAYFGVCAEVIRELGPTIPL
ncbi:MAG: anthranilate/aminodeoxychorismate synthase component II, partial [Oceanospirillales bacterium]|nr:anthranilate/aminodeoxychorismate synthase component II [Oceanospirillales bacterium]